MTLWTAVCLADDLPVGVVIPAECNDAEIAVWRSASGQVSAWVDRCPHRGMRLSHGFVRGETLNCIYHGWIYGTDGGCKRIPAHPGLVPPAVIRATAFAGMQAQGLVWVAQMGTETAPPDLADMLPVRSLVVEVSVGRLAEVLPEMGQRDGPMWRGAFAGMPVGLFVQPMANSRTRCHVLVQDRTHGIAASRWAEGLRGYAEREAST